MKRDVIWKLLKRIEIYPRAGIFLDIIVCEFAQ
jgi:hypothetical protein